MTKGFTPEENPEWESVDGAPYEEIYFPSMKSGEIYVPNGLANIGPMKFKAQNYTGMPYWENIRDNDCNPDGTKGRFKAKLEQSYLAQYAKFGFTLLVQRPKPEGEFATGFDALTTYSATEPTHWESTVGGVTQGPSDQELYVNPVVALPGGTTSVIVVNRDDRKTATVTAAATTEQPNRVLLTFTVDVTPGCAGGMQYLTTVDGVAAVPAEADEDCGCPVDPVALVCVAAVPTGSYDSAVTVTHPGHGAVVTDIATVDLGTIKVNGVVTDVTVDDITIEFTGISVSCTSGQGVLGVVYTTAPITPSPLSIVRGSEFAGLTPPFSISCRPISKNSIRLSAVSWMWRLTRRPLFTLGHHWRNPIRSLGGSVS